MKPKILVTSAGGKTGLLTALQLRELGFPVRAFVRSLDGRSRALEGAGAEIFVGDQYNLMDMRAAMQDIQRAYQCAPTAPNALHFNAVFTVAAYEAGIEHVVTLSQWLSSAGHPSLLTREVYLGDALIGMRSEMSVTTVNPGWFADNYLMVIDMAAHLGLFAMPLGAGDEKKNAAPSNADIARVVTAALTGPDVHAGKTYRPTGPELLSPNDIADAMQRPLGRRVRYMEISERMMIKSLKAIPPSNYSVGMVTQLALYAAEYRKGAFAVNAPTDHVERVGGTSPETLEMVVRQAFERQPTLSRSTARSLGALAGFLRILATQPFDLKAAERSRDYPQLKNPTFVQDDPTWSETHKTQQNQVLPLRTA